MTLLSKNYGYFIYRFRHGYGCSISAMMQIGNNVNNLMLLVPKKMNTLNQIYLVMTERLWIF